MSTHVQELVEQFVAQGHDRETVKKAVRRVLDRKKRQGCYFYERTNRRGRKVYVIDTLHPDSPTVPGDGYAHYDDHPDRYIREHRYQACCATHSTYVQVGSKQRAYEATVDTDFCEACMEEDGHDN